MAMPEYIFYVFGRLHRKSGRPLTIPRFLYILSVVQ
jgi:hypothetical protein